MATGKTNIKNSILCKRGKRPIIADIYIQDHEAPLILFCHGFKGFKDWGGFNLMAERFFQEGLHFVKFNFSHNGGTVQQVIDFPDLEAFSENTYSEEKEDISRVIKGLKEYHGLHGVWSNHETIVIGHSRGGAMATLAAARHEEVVGLVTLAAVADLEKRFLAYDVGQWKTDGVVHIMNSRTGQEMPLKYSYYQDFIRNKEAFDVLRAASKLDIPALIIHAKDDEVVKFTEALDLHRAIADSELFILDHGGHTFGMSQPWAEAQLPSPTQLVMDEVILFLKRKVGVGHGR